MSQVLNVRAPPFQRLRGSKTPVNRIASTHQDVLDFSRMERGGFSSVSRPFSLHRTMRSLVAPLQMDANSRHLTLETSFDPRIDDVAKAAAGLDGLKALEGHGVVIGDEMRLRQGGPGLLGCSLRAANICSLSCYEFGQVWFFLLPSRSGQRLTLPFSATLARSGIHSPFAEPAC